MTRRCPAQRAHTPPSPTPSTHHTQTTVLWGWAGTSTGAAPYLVECEGAHSVRGELHRVQQSDLNEAVGLSATDWPVLIALHLQKDKRRGCGQAPRARIACKGVWKCPKAQRGERAGVPGQKQGGRASLPSYKNPQTQILRSTVPPLAKPHQALMLRCHSRPRQGNEGYD